MERSIRNLGDPNGSCWMERQVSLPNRKRGRLKAVRGSDQLIVL